MKILFRLAFSVYITFMLYMTLMLLFGPTGTMAVRELDSYKARLESNIEQLEGINSELNSQLSRLMSDRETIAVLARELGYYGTGEGAINIPGYQARKNSYVVGSIVYSAESERGSQDYIRLSSLAIGILTFVSSGILRRKSHVPLQG